MAKTDVGNDERKNEACKPLVNGFYKVYPSYGQHKHGNESSQLNTWPGSCSSSDCITNVVAMNTIGDIPVCDIYGT